MRMYFSRKEESQKIVTCASPKQKQKHKCSLCVASGKYSEQISQPLCLKAITYIYNASYIYTRCIIYIICIYIHLYSLLKLSSKQVLAQMKYELESISGM